MYRAALEYILGFKLAGDRLRIDPCIPRSWREFELTYRRGQTTYRIKVDNPHSLSRGIESVFLNGLEQSSDEIVLVDDGQIHEVHILMGEKIEVEKDALATSEEAEETRK